LAAFVVAQELTAALGTEHEMSNDIGEGLRHESGALTGLGRCVGTVVLGLRSSDSLQPKLSHCGLAALTSAGTIDLGSSDSLQPKLSHCGLAALAVSVRSDSRQ
jgi:hypothetical protein